MFTAIAGFFLNTRLGQTIVLAAAITAAVALTWWRIDSVADNRGYNRARAECTAAQSTAKTDLLNSRADQARTGSDIAAKADAAGEKARNTIDTQLQRDKDKNHEDFKAPAAGGTGCALPVPAGVQARLDAAVERAND
jgi:hypothetical protein